jgi:hypothetical protein
MMFSNNDAITPDDNSLIRTAISVQSWFEEHQDILQHLPWPAQLPDFRIIEPLWPVLESRVRRLPPPQILKQQDVLCEERYSIPLETIQNLYEYSNEDTRCITGKWWPNSALINKIISFEVVSIILSIHYISQRWRVMEIMTWEKVFLLWFHVLYLCNMLHYAQLRWIQAKHRPVNTMSRTWKPTDDFYKTSTIFHSIINIFISLKFNWMLSTRVKIIGTINFTSF